MSQKTEIDPVYTEQIGHGNSVAAWACVLTMMVGAIAGGIAFANLNWVGDPHQSVTVTNAPGFSLGAGYMYANDPYIELHPSARFVEYDVVRGMFWDLSVPEQVPEPGMVSLFAAGFTLIALRGPKNRATAFRLTGWRQER